MGDATCTEDGCTRRRVARGLCNTDYQRRQKAGALPARESAIVSHSLTDFDPIRSKATCSICGPGAGIRFRRRWKNDTELDPRGKPECRGLRFNARNADGTRKYKKGTTRKGDRRAERLRRYGLSKADYERMLVRQSGRCAICLKVPDEPLCVDHCHKTGQVRGLLCRRCNLGLGHFSDDLDVFSRATRYLKTAQGQPS